jgi:DNA-binding MarR family transcriptional regulator
MDGASSPPDRAALEAALGAMLRAASANSVLFSQAVADQVGMNPTDLESLDLLERHGPMTAGRLATQTGLTTGAVTGLIDRLEKLGYARREPDPGDRRRVLVRAVPEATERDLAPRFEAMRLASEAMMADFSDAELATVLAFLHRANAVATEQIARAAAAEPRGRGRGVRAWSRRQAETAG